MSNRIFEELPARKHQQGKMSPISKPQEGGHKISKKNMSNRLAGGAKNATTPEERISQAASDIRYRAKREDMDLKTAYNDYMQHSSMSNAEKKEVEKKIFGKGGAISEQYSEVGDDLATTSVANAMFKVFVSGIQEDTELVYEGQIKRMRDGKEVTLYSIRVTDKKTGKSYTRDASREDITRLRARGLDVEMSDYVSGEKQKDMRRSRKRGDRDGDGTVESSSKEHAGLVHNAIQRATGGTPDGQDTRKEDYLWSEQTTSVEGQNAKKIDVMKSGEQNAVKVFPEIKESANEKFLRMLEEKKLSKKEKNKREKYVKGMKKSKDDFEKRYGEDGKSVMYATATKMAMQNSSFEPEGDVIDEYAKGGGGSAPNIPGAGEFIDQLPQKIQSLFNRGSAAKTKPETKKVTEEASCPKCGKSPCECDTRANKVYRDLLKAKFRAMGKNPIAMMSDDENLEKAYDKMMTASFIKTDEKGQLKPVSLFGEGREDRARDRRQERGGVDANVDYDRPPTKKKSNKELGIPEMSDEEREKRRKEMSAHLKKMRK